MTQTLFNCYEVIAGLFHFLDRKKIIIPSDTAVLHQAIYTVSRSPRYKQFFSSRDQWIWQDRISGKFDPMIESCMMNMMMGGLIEESPIDNAVIIRPKLNITWCAHIAPRLDEHQLFLFERMANHLARELARELELKREDK